MVTEPRYGIIAERILAEDGHIYEIIVADPVDTPTTFNPTQLKFGPFLLQEKSPVLQDKWRKEQARLDDVIATMQHAQQAPQAKIDAFIAQRNQIQEVILNEG